MAADLRCLSSRARGYLREGDFDGRYGGDRSRLVQALACHHRQAGATFEDFLDNLLDEENRGGEKVQQLRYRKGLFAARRYARRSWDEAGRFLAQQGGPRSSPPLRGKTSTTVAAVIFTAPWKGRASITDRVVLAGHLRIASILESREYQASDRQVSEVTGVSRRSIPSSHTRLIDRGLLQRLEKGKGDQASSWRLLSRPPSRVLSYLDKREQQVAFSPTGCVLLGKVPECPLAIDLGEAAGNLLDHLSHDAFMDRGLGPTALLVWSLLPEDGTGLTPRDARSILPLASSTMSDTLKKLHSYGLAHGPRAWHRVPVDLDHLDRIAKELGTAGHHAITAEQHDQERTDYYLSRNRLIAETHPPSSQMLNLLAKRERLRQEREAR